MHFHNLTGDLSTRNMYEMITDSLQINSTVRSNARKSHRFRTPRMAFHIDLRSFPFSTLYAVITKITTKKRILNIFAFTFIPHYLATEHEARHAVGNFRILLPPIEML